MTTTFDNHTDAALADEIGKLDRDAKAIAKRLTAAKAEFKARGLKDAAGDEFAIRRTDSTRWSLDSKAIKAAMGEDWATKFSRFATVTTIRISPAMASA